MADSDIVVTAVETRSELNAFTRLPKRLYAGNAGYVPPLDLECREAFSPTRNLLFQHLEARFFLARRAGRISVQVDRAYLERYRNSTGHFGCLAAEIDHAAKLLRPVILPELAVFVEVNDEAVAFVLALTNINEALADLGGRLNAWTLPKLLWRLKIAGLDSLRVPLMSVKKKYRNHPVLGAGLALLAIDRPRETARRLGKKAAELGWLLEDNKAADNIMRSVGGVVYKTHRLYEKALA